MSTSPHDSNGGAAPPEPEFLDVAALARLVRLSLPAARAMVRRGEIPGARRLGRKWLIHRDTFVLSFSTSVNASATTHTLDPARLLRPIPRRCRRNP